MLILCYCHIIVKICEVTSQKLHALLLQAEQMNLNFITLNQMLATCEPLSFPLHAKRVKQIPESFLYSYIAYSLNT